MVLGRMLVLASGMVLVTIGLLMAMDTPYDAERVVLGAGMVLVGGLLLVRMVHVAHEIERRKEREYDDVG